MSQENKEVVETEVTESTPTEMPGLTASMEVAGVESIPGVDPGRIVLGFSKE